MSNVTFFINSSLILSLDRGKERETCKDVDNLLSNGSEEDNCGGGDDKVLDDGRFTKKSAIISIIV